MLLLSQEASGIYQGFSGGMVLHAGFSQA